MRKIIIICCIFAFNFSFAQKRVFNEIEKTKLQNSGNKKTFSVFTHAIDTISVNKAFISQNSVLELVANEDILKQLELEKKTFVSIEIPSPNPLILELIPIEIFSNSYSVINSLNEQVKTKRGVHYRGIIKGDNSSLVSISIVDGEIFGIISSNKGNYVLGKLKSSSKYVYYLDSNISKKLDFKCQLSDDSLQYNSHNYTSSLIATNGVACKPVEIYFEIDNELYANLGSSIISTTNYVNALFAQVATLYNNENITIQISQLKIWDTVDPYVNAPSFSNMLVAFVINHSRNFPGDLAHLLSGRQLNAGIANISGLCNKGSGVSTSIGSPIINIPTYSWNVFVVTHELGHNLGSQHTQHCSWPGGPIDNCVNPEGNCLPGPTPTNGGTIMSYCYQTSIGVNFNNGFGTLPGNLIRTRVQECLGTYLAPSELTAEEIYNTSVVVGWKRDFGGIFTVEYKPLNSNIWTSVTTTKPSIKISGLTPNTSYNWRVKVACSEFSYSVFSTNNQSPINYCEISYYTCSSRIDDVIIDDINFYSSTECFTGGYSLIIVPSRNLIIGKTNNLVLNCFGVSLYASIWIDFNKNGIFEPSEKVFASTASTSSKISGYFTIPNNIIPISKVRMRVVVTKSSEVIEPCGEYFSGETEDFLISLTNNSNCPEMVSLTNNLYSGTTIVQASAVSGKIIATNSISGVGTHVFYTAKTIELNSGFKVESGSIFKAEIGGCNN